MIRNSKYINALQRVHGWWKCISTYIEHTFEQIYETTGISLIRPTHVTALQYFVLDESGAVRHQRIEVEPRDLYSRPLAMLDGGSFLFILFIKRRRGNEKKCFKDY
jgi:hypothetical protein